MAKIQNAAVEHATLARADQPAAGPDEFGPAMRQAKASGNPQNAAPSPDHENEAGSTGTGNKLQANVQDLARGAGLSTVRETAGFVKSIESTTSGADVAKTLEVASKARDIDQLPSKLSPSELNTVSRELNGAGLSKNDLSAPCNSIVSGGASGRNLARQTEAFIDNPPDESKYIASTMGGPFVSPSHLTVPPPDLAATLESSSQGSIASRRSGPKLRHRPGCICHRHCSRQSQGRSPGRQSGFRSIVQLTARAERGPDR